MLELPIIGFHDTDNSPARTMSGGAHATAQIIWIIWGSAPVGVHKKTAIRPYFGGVIFCRSPPCGQAICMQPGSCSASGQKRALKQRRRLDYPGADVARLYFLYFFDVGRMMPVIYRSCG